MTRAEDRLYVGGWFGARKPDRGCWYERIEAGLDASVEGGDDGEQDAPRGRALKRSFDFTPQLGDEGWEGEGYELIGKDAAVAWFSSCCHLHGWLAPSPSSGSNQLPESQSARDLPGGLRAPLPRWGSDDAGSRMMAEAQ